jgi:Tat protein secretion system quality control protein TatD with DNase activity
VAHVGEHIAGLRDITVAEVAAATTANARAVFALAPR